MPLFAGRMVCRILVLSFPPPLQRVCSLSPSRRNGQHTTNGGIRHVDGISLALTKQRSWCVHGVPGCTNVYGEQLDWWGELPSSRRYIGRCRHQGRYAMRSVGLGAVLRNIYYLWCASPLTGHARTCDTVFAVIAKARRTREREIEGEPGPDPSLAHSCARPWSDPPLGADERRGCHPTRGTRLSLSLL
jgi:hypothetical protein